MKIAPMQMCFIFKVAAGELRCFDNSWVFFNASPRAICSCDLSVRSAHRNIHRHSLNKQLNR